MTLLIPQAGARSRFLFDFNAAPSLGEKHQALTARTGQPATFTRAGLQYAPDSAGRSQIFPSGVPAIDWAVDPVTGLSTPGVLLEMARTNVLLNSGAIGGAGWAGVNVTVNPDAAVAPNGLQAADLLTVTAAGAATMAQSVVLASTQASASIYCHYGSGVTDANQFRLTNVTAGGTIIAQASLNYATGVLTVNAGSAAVEALANQWYRVTLTATSGITSGDTLAFAIGFIPGTSYAAGVYGYFWGAQLEGGAASSSYIPTTSGAVQRIGGVLSFVYNAIPAACTVYERHVDRGSQANPTCSLYQVGGWGSTGSLTVYHASATTIYGTHLGAVGQVTSGGQVCNIARGDVVETRLIVRATGSVQLGVSKNGGAEVLDVEGAAQPFFTAWNTNTITFNRRQSATYDGAASFQRFRIAAGVRSLDYMRRGGA
jgi:hypothetical protein